MIQQLLRFVTVALSLSTVSAAIDSDRQIPPECLKKTDIFGIRSIGATKFDQKASFITKNIERDFVLEKFNTCVDEKGQLSSINFAFADTATGQITILDQVGPRSRFCRSAEFHNEGFVDRVRVFKNEERITGIGIGYAEGNIVQRIGRESGWSADFDFQQDQQIVGFFGELSGDTGVITLIGVVYQDILCTQYNSNADYRRAVDSSKVDRTRRAEQPTTMEYETKETRGNVMEDIGSQVFYIVLALSILVFAFIACAWYYSRRRKVRMWQRTESKKSVCKTEQQNEVQIEVTESPKNNLGTEADQPITQQTYPTEASNNIV